MPIDMGISYVDVHELHKMSRYVSMQVNAELKILLRNLHNNPRFFRASPGNNLRLTGNVLKLIQF